MLIFLFHSVNLFIFQYAGVLSKSYLLPSFIAIPPASFGNNAIITLIILSLRTD